MKTPFAIVGNVETIRDLLCGPQQHDEHLRAHRWHLYVQDDAKRFENVMREVRRLRDMHRADTIAQLAAEAAE